MLFRSIPIGLLACSLAGAAVATPDGRSRVEFISVEANTGGSSGGHAALRIGDSVYHYMAGSFDSLLLIYRIPWENFHRRYCLLENRGLKIRRLALGDDAITRIETRLKILHAVQDKHVGRRDALDIQRQWLASLDGTSPCPKLDCLGFFQRDGGTRDADMRQLQKKVAAALGRRFIDTELAELTAKLKGCALEVSAPREGAIDPGRYPQNAEIAAERLLDRLLLREALLALRDGFGLDGSTLRQPDNQPLSAAERRQIAGFAEELASSMVRLLRSPRPDRGRPLLLATARYLAARRSLEKDRMLLLDTFPDTAKSLNPARTRRHRELLQSLADKSGNAWRETRSWAFGADGGLDILSNNLLEIAASRHADLYAAARDGTPARVIGILRRPPSRAATATRIEIAFDAGDLAAAGERCEAAYAASERHIQGAYGFDLLRHNCGTQLTAAIRSAFRDEASADAALGGTIVPGKGLSIIPAVLANKVGRRWNVSSTREESSRRRAQVERLSATGKRPLLIRLRECNRLTSEVYPGSIEDHAFLFFADGSVVLRPLQGLANFAYGLGQSGIGIATLPFDKGRRAASGARGMFWSIPELIGLSIRKGQYDLPPEALTKSTAD